MISYSQNAEDVLLERLFHALKKGFYVDVGAGHPTHESVTYHFYKKGWSGINIEPIKKLYDLYNKERSRDINLNIGISNQNGPFEFMETFPFYGMSTFKTTLSQDVLKNVQQIQKYTVQCHLLVDILERYVRNKTIQFLKIDVEGFEKNVLESNDWEKYRPQVVIIESTYPCSCSDPCFEEWEYILLEKDYLFCLFDGLNNYYVRKEDQNLKQYLNFGVCHRDDFIQYKYKILEDELQQFKKLQLCEKSKLVKTAVKLALKFKI